MLSHSQSHHLSGQAQAPDISTIFVIGFPDDFKERELVNMFLFAPGFEGSVLKTTTISSGDEPNRKQLIGFVKFSKAGEAGYALEVLNGRILDQERGLVLKAEIAKKNLHIKSTSTRKSISEDDFGFGLSPSSPPSCTCGGTCSSCSGVISRSTVLTPSPSPASQLNYRNRMMSITLPGQSDPSIICAPDEGESEIAPSTSSIANVPSIAGISNISVVSNTSNVPSIASVSSKIEANSPPTTAPSSLLYLPQISSSKQLLMIPVISDRVLDISTLQRKMIASPSLGSMAAVFGENFPCNTLYVGNLVAGAQEEELRALFRNCLGYRRLSFRPKSSGPMCFVEFEDIACATAAMETLYGTMISCSTPAKGGIRLSFSKNPLGLRVASPAPTIIDGAETDNPDHRQAISTIFAHYYKINPHKT